jgi:GNAT superfamily N-acetyltransferase
MESLSIRPATRRDLDILLDWAAAEGWNPGHLDADAFYDADPGGFLIGWLGEHPVASISVVSYDGDLGFLGFYIAHPDHRGREYGTQVWNAGIARLGDRTIGLDGVVDQQKNYAKSGFVLAHRNIRHGGVAHAERPTGRPLVDITEATPDLVAWDSVIFGARREAFLTRWVATNGHVTVAWREASDIRGYGTIRPCREGHKIGPLFAERPEIAAALFDALVARYSGTTVLLDTPEPNREAIALAESHGMKPVFETARMYRGRAPKLPLHHIYGITTFELG